MAEPGQPHPLSQLQLPLFSLLAERECGLWRPWSLDRHVKEARAHDVRLSECQKDTLYTTYTLSS